MARSRSWLAWRAVAAVALIGLLVAGGFAIHRLGWSQGYTAAELAAQGEVAPAPPLSPRGWRPIGFARGGLLISLVLGLAFFALVGKLLRFILWGAMAGPAMRRTGHGRFGRHPRYWMHRPVPLWYAPCHEWPGDKPRQTEDQVSGNANA